MIGTIETKAVDILETAVRNYLAPDDKAPRDSKST
jgi:hypothetical protein